MKREIYKLLSLVLAMLMLCPSNVFAEVNGGSTTLNMDVEGNDICPLEILVPDTAHLEYDSTTNTWRDDSTVTVKGYIDFENSMNLYVDKDVTFKNALGFKTDGYVEFGRYERDARDLAGILISPAQKFEVISRELAMNTNGGTDIVGTSFPISFITEKSDINFAGSYEATVNFVYTLTPTTGIGTFDGVNSLVNIKHSWQYLEDRRIIRDNSNASNFSLAKAKFLHGYEIDSITPEDGFSIDGTMLENEYSTCDTISISSLKYALFKESLNRCEGKRIYIPSSICYIEADAFFACKDSEFFYEGTTADWFAIEGITYKVLLQTKYTAVFGNIETRYGEDVIVQCSDGFVRYAVDGSVYENR